jgi:hypothetical protein
MTYSVHGHVILTCLTLAEDYLHEKKGGEVMCMTLRTLTDIFQSLDTDTAVR